MNKLAIVYLFSLVVIIPAYAAEQPSEQPQSRSVTTICRQDPCLDKVKLLAQLLVVEFPLCTAAKNGNAMHVQLLLDSGKVNVNEIDNDRNTPLHWAADQGHKLVVQVLLAAKADFNAKDRYDCTPLHKAAQKDHTTIIELLIKAGALIEENAQMNMTPLGTAVWFQNVRAVEVLLATGANANVKLASGTPLHRACESCNVQIVQALLVARANVREKDVCGHTPLHDACSRPMGEKRERDNAPIVKALLEAGAPVNDTDEFGATPLHKACQFKELPIVQILLASGANPNARTSMGYTPLHMLCIHPNMAIIKELLAANCNPNIVDNKGETPEQSAGALLHDDAKDLLKQWPINLKPHFIRGVNFSSCLPFLMAMQTRCGARSHARILSSHDLRYICSFLNPTTCSLFHNLDCVYTWSEVEKFIAVGRSRQPIQNFSEQQQKNKQTNDTCSVC